MTTLTDFLAAIEHGAASIYHAVLGTGTEIANWASDPVVAPLLSEGATVANAALSSVGLGGIATVVATDVVNGLKTIAAADPTVPSTGSISALLGLAGTVAVALVPGAAEIVAGVEGAVAVAEGLANSITSAPPADPAVAS